MSRTSRQRRSSRHCGRVQPGLLAGRCVQLARPEHDRPHLPVSSRPQQPSSCICVTCSTFRMELINRTRKPGTTSARCGSQLESRGSEKNAPLLLLMVEILFRPSCSCAAIPCCSPRRRLDDRSRSLSQTDPRFGSPPLHSTGYLFITATVGRLPSNQIGEAYRALVALPPR